MNLGLLCIQSDIVMLWQDCKRWLRDHGVTSKTELGYYVDCVTDLFTSSSLDNYREM